MEEYFGGGGGVFEGGGVRRQGVCCGSKRQGVWGIGCGGRPQEGRWRWRGRGGVQGEGCGERKQVWGTGLFVNVAIERKENTRCKKTLPGVSRL